VHKADAFCVVGKSADKFCVSFFLKKTVSWTNDDFCHFFVRSIVFFLFVNVCLLLSQQWLSVLSFDMMELTTKAPCCCTGNELKYRKFFLNNVKDGQPDTRVKKYKS